MGVGRDDSGDHRVRFSIGHLPGPPAQAAAADAVNRCPVDAGCSQTPERTGSCVVFDLYVTSQFLGLVAELLSGEAVLRGGPAFAGRVGSRRPALGHPSSTTRPIRSLPTADDTDGEGRAAPGRSPDLGGVLGGYLHNAYTARASGVSTGSAQRGGHKGVPGWVRNGCSPAAPAGSPIVLAQGSATGCW